MLVENKVLLLSFCFIFLSGCKDCVPLQVIKPISAIFLKVRISTSQYKLSDLIEAPGFSVASVSILQAQSQHFLSPAGKLFHSRLETQFTKLVSQLDVFQIGVLLLLYSFCEIICPFQFFVFTKQLLLHHCFHSGKVFFGWCLLLFIVIFNSVFIGNDGRY